MLRKTNIKKRVVLQLSFSSTVGVPLGSEDEAVPETDERAGEPSSILQVLILVKLTLGLAN